jgi:hypothetical protein
MMLLYHILEGNVHLIPSTTTYKKTTLFRVIS